MFSLNAYAKINLLLDVLRKRSDGYHDVQMIMQMINLYDVLDFEEIVGKDFELVIEHEKLQDTTDNLITKAAKAFFEQYGTCFGVRITLHKNIPIAAGMAGGSTDAATTLRGLNQMAGDPFDDQKLCEIGVKIGADIPYCIMGGTVLAEGIGEKLTPIMTPPDTYLLIAKPDIDVSTAFVYQNLKIDECMSHPDLEGMLQAIKQQDIKKIATKLQNVLETVTIPAYPIIAQIKERCLTNGSFGTLMSGSGPTVFAFFDTESDATHVKEIISNSKLASQVYVTGFYKK